MAQVVVAASRCVAPHDIFAIEFCRYLNMLTDRQTEDIFGVGETEPITAKSIRAGRLTTAKRSTYMAVFGDRTIFSTKVNSCHTLGSKTGFFSDLRVHC